jgi:Carbohydrate family 9 binding domain-like
LKESGDVLIADPEITTNTPVIAGVYSPNDSEPASWDANGWTRAQPIQITRIWNGDPAPESRHSEARILWSERYLMVRFVCRQEEPLLVSQTPQSDRKTDRLWDRDVCEIFVAPEAKTPERYFEFEASPVGEWIDLEIVFTAQGRKTNFDYHSGMQTTATIQDNQTMITIAIPWSSHLPKPSVGDVWRVNLFRCIGVGDERFLAWLPTFTEEPNFHVPKAFGSLKFVRDGDY